MSAGIPRNSSRRIPRNSSRRIPRNSSRRILCVTLLLSPLWDKPMHSPSKNEKNKIK
jgi:hypothetical protein